MANPGLAGASEATSQGMTMARFSALVAAYGAVPSHWPEAERQAAATLLANSAEARVLSAEARAVDSVLDSAPPVPMTANLQARIMAGFDAFAAQPSFRSFVRMIANIVWPGAPLWQPSAALAASLVAGVVLGVLSPLGSAARPASSDITVALAVPQSSYLDQAP